MLVKIIELYSYIVLASVVISWLNLPRDNQLTKVLDDLTEPALKPIRSILPPSGGMDFSPLVLLVGLQILVKALH